MVQSNSREPPLKIRKDYIKICIINMKIETPADAEAITIETVFAYSTLSA